ncbi:MAG: transcription antitermination factor NusB [Pseudomonadota bacterium]|nr:transcription antitermination factor NusB [Pseudomonadota bacterium]
MGGRRSLARRYAVLALYQWQLTGQSPAEIGRHFVEDPEWVAEVAASLANGADDAVLVDGPQPTYDRGLFEQLLNGVPKHLQDLDAQLQTALDRPIERVDPVERAILRLGAYELLHCLDLPYRVAINEAVDLAKLFGAEQGHRYVNGVLDRLARDTRRTETRAGKAPGREPNPS